MKFDRLYEEIINESYLEDYIDPYLISDIKDKIGKSDFRKLSKEIEKQVDNLNYSDEDEIDKKMPLDKINDLKDFKTYVKLLSNFSDSKVLPKYIPKL